MRAAIEAPARRLYLDRSGEIFCLVDAIDYEWAIQWRWGFVKSRGVDKFYASRSTRLHGSSGPQTRIYLHKEILKRAGLVAPSEDHTIGDHKNGDSLDDRRLNLRWATVVENNRNRFGSYAKQHRIALPAAADIPF